MKNDNAVFMMSINSIKPYANNPRINKKAIEPVKKSIELYGFQNPLILDKHNVIVVGHTRYQAACELGYRELPCMYAKKNGKYLTEAECKGYRIADNATGEYASWDKDLLKLELGDLKLDFDDINLSDLTAFKMSDISNLIDTSIQGEDDIPTVIKTNIKRGDIFKLGNHYLMCGDSTSKSDVDKLLSGVYVNAVITDPPYGINVVKPSGNVGSSGKRGKDKFGKIGGGGVIKAGVYPVIVGDTDTDTARNAINICRDMNIPIQIYWGGNFYTDFLPKSSCWVVWNKLTNGNFADAELAWCNLPYSIRLFTHRWAGMIKASENNQKRVHPTQKPIALFEWLLNEFKISGVILDLFLGSGSTLIACEKAARICYGMEISPEYCQVIIDRYKAFTNRDDVVQVNKPKIIKANNV